MSDNSRSATPISSPRWLGTMMRAELSGIFVEADQVRGQPPHRPHEQIMQREIDQRRGQHRDQQRDQQQVAGKAVHRLPQRQFVDHDLDELRAAGRRPDHADRLVAGLQHDLERIDDRRPHRHVAHVDVVIDRRRQVGAGEQPALLPHLDGDRARADAGRGSAAPANPAPCPSGAASSTSAAVLAAASRSLSRLMRKLAIAGT